MENNLGPNIEPWGNRKLPFFDSDLFPEIEQTADT